MSSKKTFTQRLAERGYSEGKSGRERFYVGLKTHSNKVQMPLKPTQAEVVVDVNYPDRSATTILAGGSGE